MKSTIGQRLKSFLETKKMSQEEFAEILKVVPQNVSSWINGKTAITTKYFPVILNLFPDLDARWLLTGQYPLAGENPLIVEDPHYPNQKCTNPACIKEIEYLQNRAEELRADKIFLQETVEDLRIKVGSPSENSIQGGVE